MNEDRKGGSHHQNLLSAPSLEFRSVMSGKNLLPPLSIPFSFSDLGVKLFASNPSPPLNFRRLLCLFQPHCTHPRNRSNST